MDIKIREISVLLLLAVGAYCKTLRYRIITDEEGKRELVPDHNSTSRSPDIDFLEKDLNIPNPSSEKKADENVQMETSTKKIVPLHDSIPEDHYQLMRKWNTFTADGWTRQKNALYANSTKLVIYDDGSKKNDTIVEVKQGRSENFTTEREEEPPFPMLWDVFTRLYECFQPNTHHNGTFDCIQTRVTNMLMAFLGKSFDSDDERSHVEEKTLTHGKKLLKGALLPLLVLLLIKYLIALPVLAAGVVTIKTFWLSLLSAGVAAFGAPWKKHVLKRHEPDIVFTQPPPWLTGMEKYQKGKYFM